MQLAKHTAAAARPRSARARPRRARSPPAARRMRTWRTTRPASGPRRRTSQRTDAPAPTEVALRSRKASVVAQAQLVRVRSTLAPTASCSRTTRVTWPQSSTNISRGHSHSTSPKRACRWCRATCRRRSSTRRRAGRPAAPAQASTSTTTTRGTSTTRGTGTRRTGTRPSTTRRRRTTTWRRRATAACCWAAARCTTSTSPWTGRRSTTRRTTSTPPPARPTPTPPCPVWRRRCKTLPRTCTGSERRAPSGRPAAGVLRSACEGGSAADGRAVRLRRAAVAQHSDYATNIILCCALF